MSSNILSEIHSKLTGALDAELVQELRPLLDQLAETAKEDVVLDLSQVNFLDSSGIGALVFLFKRLRAKKLNLILAGVNGQPLEIIQYLKIDKTITLQKK